MFKGVLNVYIAITGHSALEDVKSKQEQIVLGRSARLNMDPGRDDLGDGGDR